MDHILEETPANHKSGYVVLIGRPNAGKSTLMNAFLGKKLSIVTHKPQTTRHRVLGIMSDDDSQVIFLDTPGIIKPKYRLQELMMHSVDHAVAEADVVVIMVDVTQERTKEHVIARARPDKPTLLILNKMDLIKKEEALPMVTKYMEAYPFDAVIPISAKRGKNLDTLRQQIMDRLPLGPAYYPKSMLSEHPERFFVSEIIREKIFKQFHQEVPYSTQVNIIKWDEKPNQDFIDAEIVVGRDSQKGILIGKGGLALKKLGTHARKGIEALIDKPIYLQLHVKVRDNWRNNDTYLRSYGYND